MITTSKLQYIKDNIYIPEVGDYTDADDNNSEYRVAGLGYDGDYFIGDTCMTIHKDHYDAFVSFLKNLPDKQDFADSNTLPYRRDDTVVGSPCITGIYYIDPNTRKGFLVGYDEFPVICLPTNEDCYFEDCQNWTVEDEVIETDVHQALASSLGGMLVESKVIKDQAYGLEAEGVAFQLFRNRFPNVSEPDILSVDPDDKVTYFDMPQEDIEWLGEHS